MDFEAAAGEVHALLGDNGAGKSTLIKILSGVYQPSEGELLVAGVKRQFRSPRDALDAGIAMVHQHFRLVSPFTVAENVVLGDHRSIGKTFVLRARAIERGVAQLSRRYGLAVEPRARIWQLSLGEQQRVEILKALYQDARILILDEPTAVLTPQEAEALFETIRAMADDGRTIIFISHKLHEVKAVADRVTVLRRGRSIATVPAADGDRGGAAIKDVSLSVRAGEILAVAGVAGNGQRELAETVAGMRPPIDGTISVVGRRLRGGDPREAIGVGIAYVPEDRLGTGVAPGLSVASNIVLKSYRRPPASRGPLLLVRKIRELARTLMEQYDVRASGPEVPARQLSGGNLQKLVLAREFSGEPGILVAASPTRGLDVAGIETVHSYLRSAAESGVALLLISEDLDEILALADRIVVMYEGSIVGERDASAATVEELGLLMAGGEERS